VRRKGNPLHLADGERYATDKSYDEQDDGQFGERISSGEKDTVGKRLSRRVAHVEGGPRAREKGERRSFEIAETV
jgi:hypothetical protein